ncbi:rhodanese-like domain-containing protein [Thermochromatium tepidum]|uniref:Rhodanese-like domain-containing protein n=1 Tax=Thermochromatium tepidum ATCC 43061 TaxID=316276 RepID=A0A6I6E6A7_THETI|nr:rhodanese-like domain-containing protein [Thermochromatium tepidum]QGU32203.1 rhodanese-like domain-containing protein [Thermochromatium tepidum ATCC 43061]
MTQTLDEFAATIVPAQMGNARIAIDAFITAYNKGEAELLDIRVPEETAVWQLNFGLHIPANELPARLDELPKDKLLVVACPLTDRSNMARSYLIAQGFNAKYLQGGLLGLVDRLKGVGAQDIRLDR